MRPVHVRILTALTDPSEPPAPSGTVVADGLVVTLHYTLRDLEGKIRRDTRSGAPLTYFRGPTRLPTGIERAIDGCGVGDSVRAELSPFDGFGPRRGTGPIRVQRRELPKGVVAREGRSFAFARPGAAPVQVWIVCVVRQQVWLDLDHPLPGETLQLDAEIVAPTPAERRLLATTSGSASLVG